MMEIKKYMPIQDKQKKITGINNIYTCLYGGQKTAGGYKWEYAE